MFSPVTEAVSGAVSGADDVDGIAVAALCVSILAILFTGANTWVNIRNRMDQRSVSFVLVGSMQRPDEGFAAGPELRRVWQLFNAGEATITNPQIEVIGEDPWPVMYFTGSGILAASEGLQVVPVGHYPAPDFQGGSYWRDRGAVVKWRTGRGRDRSAPASVSFSYV